MKSNKTIMQVDFLFIINWYEWKVYLYDCFIIIYYLHVMSRILGMKTLTVGNLVSCLNIVLSKCCEQTPNKSNNIQHI